MVMGEQTCHHVGMLRRDEKIPDTTCLFRVCVCVCVGSSVPVPPMAPCGSDAATLVKLSINQFNAGF